MRIESPLANSPPPTPPLRPFPTPHTHIPLPPGKKKPTRPKRTPPARASPRTRRTPPRRARRRGASRDTRDTFSSARSSAPSATSPRTLAPVVPPRASRRRTSRVRTASDPPRRRRRIDASPPPRVDVFGAPEGRVFASSRVFALRGGGERAGSPRDVSRADVPHRRESKDGGAVSDVERERGEVSRDARNLSRRRASVRARVRPRGRGSRGRPSRLGPGVRTGHLRARTRRREGGGVAQNARGEGVRATLSNRAGTGARALRRETRRARERNLRRREIARVKRRHPGGDTLEGRRVRGVHRGERRGRRR